MDRQWVESFQEKLDNHYIWPSVYLFKFIVPTGREEEVKGLFPEKHPATEKQSKQGNYTSVSVQIMMPSSAAVIDIYERASKIEGIVAL